MILTHKLEWCGESGFLARNKEWDERVKQRKLLEAKNRKTPGSVEIPSWLMVQPYTEAHLINSFCHMVYGLRWDEPR